MNEGNTDFLVGLILGGVVFSLLGFNAIRSLSASIRNLTLKKYPRLYNYYGIISGTIIFIWVLILFLVLGYLWGKYN